MLIAPSGTPTCPGTMLKQYCTKAAVEHTSENVLFRGVVRTKNGERLRNSGHITCSYTRVRELTLQRLKKLGYDASLFSMHSFRAGGATAAANVGVPDRLFKRHGRWRSESAKDGYVKDSVESRLSVSQSLKL